MQDLQGALKIWAHKSDLVQIFGVDLAQNAINSKQGAFHLAQNARNFKQNALNLTQKGLK